MLPDSGTVPRFEPFRALRFADGIDPARVTTPPYDVIAPAERERLAASDVHNMVHVDCPPPGGYAEAAARLAAWQAEGVLVRDPEPTVSLYRMTAPDGSATTGVIGALELSPPGEGDVLPHERTTPKARSDRLELLRATGVNLSPVWGLSMATGLGRACAPDGPPLAAMTDPDGVRHEIWRVTDPARRSALCALVSSAPVVIADGHHRYETSLQYRYERAAAGAVDGSDLTMAFVVELAPGELRVQAIHRLLADLPAGVALPEALADSFELHRNGPAGPGTLADMDRLGALAWVDADASVTFLRPRPGAFPGRRDLDSLRLDVALERAGLHPTVTYQHGLRPVLDALGRAAAQAAVLLRPVSVATIEAMARDRELMPPKSTFFAPKPRTGFVLRPLAP